MISARENQLPTTDREALVAKLQFANSTLPFVSSVVREIEQLSNEHRSIRTRLGEIDLHHHLQENSDLYSDELRAVEESADQLCARLQECYQELGQIEGLHFDRSLPSFLDFCLETEEGLLHFCWKLGEPSVAHWHWADEPCAERRSIIGYDELTRVNSTQAV